jgi:DNA-binding ferritin-like protein
VPTSPSELRDVEYWRKRAEESRALAEEMKDADTKSLMIGIAESYERIAASYEAIADYEKRHREK